MSRNDTISEMAAVSTQRGLRPAKHTSRPLAKVLPVTFAALLVAGCQIQPIAYNQAELSSYASDKLTRVTQDQEPISGKITLYEAMARSLKYNLDYRVEIMNRQLANSKLRLQSYDMLPKLVANGGWADRNNSPASFSKTLFAGVTSTDPSTSDDPGKFAGDVTFSWHILDFGLSYVRAKQAGDEALIAEERKRKVINRIIEDVRTAYWRAVSADRLLDGFHKLRHRTEKALAQSRRLYKAGNSSPVAALSYQRELLDIKGQIHRLERELRTAKMQLAALMNVSPGSKYSLHIPKRRLTDLKITANGDEMVKLAINNRPELREVAYKQRINQQEAKAALLGILPGLQVYAGANLDTNDFLYNSNWISYGAKIGWNLMKVFAYPAQKRSVKAKEDLLDKRALATTMAIMTQVYVSRARYHHLLQSASNASEYYSVQRRLRTQIRSSVRAGVASEQTLIREEMNTLVAAVKFDLAYAELQNAFAAIYASVGVDPYDEGISLDM
ncbi:MAG: TolC family protein, partial [Pseudomonadota bacterium]